VIRRRRATHDSSAAAPSDASAPFEVRASYAQLPELPVSAPAGATHFPEATSHVAPATHASLEVHVLAQLPVVSHLKGAHAVVVPSTAIEVCSSTHFAAETHLPLLHRPPCVQSASTLHAVLHVPIASSHTYAPQSVGVAAGQLPLPSQLAAAIAPAAPQLALRHDTSLPTNPLQLARVWPSHVCVSHGCDASPTGHTSRPPWGAPVTGAHVPSAPFTSHASH
jgi:hypothetical protein